MILDKTCGGSRIIAGLGNEGEYNRRTYDHGDLRHDYVGRAEKAPQRCHLG